MWLNRLGPIILYQNLKRIMINIRRTLRLILNIEDIGKIFWNLTAANFHKMDREREWQTIDKCISLPLHPCNVEFSF